MDRYFINKTATDILDLKNGTFISYDGDYDYYLAKRELVEANVFGQNNIVETEKKASAAKLDWAKQKEAEAAKRKLLSSISKCEKEIEQLEMRISEIDKELLNPAIATNSYELTKLTNEQDELNTRLLQVMEEWEALQS